MAMDVKILLKIVDGVLGLRLSDDKLGPTYSLFGIEKRLYVQHYMFSQYSAMNSKLEKPRAERWKKRVGRKIGGWGNFLTACFFFFFFIK